MTQITSHQTDQSHHPEGDIFSISNVQRYMFRLMAQEFEHILCNYIEISFYLLLLLAKMKILLNKGRRIFISNSLR